MVVDSSGANAGAAEEPPLTPARAGPETSGNTTPLRLPKKMLLSCGIEAHTIQKCQSPKKKVLDPLRYIPERASYYALFTFVAHFEDHAGDYQTLRSYEQIRALHGQLLKKFPKSKLPKDLPSMRKKRFDNVYIEQKTKELNEYLRQLLDLAEVKQSKLLRDFLEESPQSEDSDNDDESVSTKMLDGLPGTIVRVRAGQSFSLSLRLQNAGDVASWQFTTKKHNIGFSATFNGETVRVYSREESQVKPAKGSFKCTEPGTLSLDWDNTYTWSKTKVLIYWAEVEQTRGLSSLDLDAIGASPLSPTSDATPMIDGRRAGYIAHSRNAALYPRQIMNSSLSLITKPFIWGRSDSSSSIKTGMLIVERNLKFRGRNWYQKWFVLDPVKCVLRYYDSEHASRKGLSLAKMNLSTKNACLAITSNDEGAPTPYLFMVRARKRCWKLCASSQADYNEWEHAISTAILAAQSKRRSKRSNSTDAEGTVDKNNLDAANDNDDEDSDEEEDEEDGAKEDDEGSEDEENEMDAAHGRESMDSALGSPTKFSSESTIELSSPEAEISLDKVSSSHALTRESIDNHSQSLRCEALLSFWYHWASSLRRVSQCKRVLLLLWLNGIVLCHRESSTMTMLLIVVTLNGYLAVHSLGGSQRRPRGSIR